MGAAIGMARLTAYAAKTENARDTRTGEWKIAVIAIARDIGIGKEDRSEGILILEEVSQVGHANSDHERDP